MPPTHSYWPITQKEADTDSYSESVQFYEEISEVAKGEVLEHYRKQCGGEAFWVQPDTEIKIYWIWVDSHTRLPLQHLSKQQEIIPAHGQTIKAAET